MAITQTSLRTSIGAGSVGAIADTNAEHQAVNDLTTVFNGWQTTDRAVKTDEVFVNALDHGIVGDGVTSDRVALTAFLAAWDGSGATLFFPPATYLIETSPTTTPSPKLTVGNVRLLGVPGATIFKGSSWTDTGTLRSFIEIGASGGVSTCVDVTVEGITFTYPAHTGAKTSTGAVRFNRSDRCQLRNCHIDNSPGSGVAFSHIADFVAEGNTVTTSLADGFIIDSGTGSDVALDHPVNNVRIINNSFTNTGDDAVSFYLRTTSSRPRASRVLVQGNIVNGTAAGGGCGIYGVDGFVVADNIINNPASNGIAAIEYVNGPSWSNKNGNIHGNVIMSSLSPGTPSAAGPFGILVGDRSATPTGTEEQAPSCDTVVVENNVVVAADRHGVGCTATGARASDEALWTTNVIIRNNRFVFTGTAPSLDFRGAYFLCIKNFTLEGNQFFNFASSGMTMRSHLFTRLIGNRWIECCANATYATQPLVVVGDTNYTNDSLLQFSRNVVRKTSGTATYCFKVGNNGTLGANWYYDANLYETTGATLTGGVESFAAQPTLARTERGPITYTGAVNFTGTASINGTPIISAAAPQINTFTASGTYTKPAGATLVRALVIGGGAGGGSGRRGAAASVRCGGGGGGGGGMSVYELDAADVGSTVSVTIGPGGAGGAAVTANDTNGNNGTGGTSTTFGALASGGGAGAGNGGSATAGTGGGGGAGGFVGGAGGAASTTGLVGASASASSAGAGGGGAGGGISAADAAANGGTGLTSRAIGTTTSAGGVVDSTAPGTGSTVSGKGQAGPGGGGGAASITTVAQTGATPIWYGGGGGGGGASLNGNNSGAGGAGAPGYCLVVTYFS